MSAYKKDLLAFLNHGLKDTRVVVMPDFFQDRIVNLDSDSQSFFSTVDDVVQRKGGSIDQIQQTDLLGGNAINVASALATLGANVTPIIVTDESGKNQLRNRMKHNPLFLEYVKIAQKASITTALEFKTKDGKANVMLRDLGSLADFGPSNLTRKDYELMHNADYVCLFNWAGTKKFGTELAEAVFHYTKTRGKAKTYFATADPTPNKEQIPKLLKHVLTNFDLDILSLNENEAVQYASTLTPEIVEIKRKLEFNELALQSAQTLAKHLDSRIDLHTTAFSATITKKHAVLVPAFKITTQRATGAGDAWDAGNIIGDANQLSDECRLALANAVAACYLSSSNATYPSRQELAAFIEKAASLSVRV